MIDFPAPVEAMGKVRIPKNFNGRNPQMRRDLASALRSRRPTTWRRRRRAPSSAATRPDAHARRRRDRPAARRAARAPVPRLPRPRGPRPLGGALLQARPGRADAAAPGRAAHQHGGPAVRPGLRRADRPRLPRRRHGHRPGPAPDAASTPTWTWWPPSRCASGCGTTSSPSGLAAALSVLVFEARRPDDASSPRLPGRRRYARSSARWCSSGATLDALERDHKLDFLRAAGPRLRLGRLPVGRGRRPRRRAQGQRPRRRRLRALDEAAASTSPARSPTPPATARCAETARQTVVRRCAGGRCAYSALTDARLERRSRRIARRSLDRRRRR